jgi:RHS repeat-associated protein
MGSETILFVGAHYEVKNGSEITKYYLAGSTRIAMRKYTIPQNMTVEYLLGDHLGSTSLTTDTSGAKVLELRYKPWGEIRYSWNAPQTTTPAYKSPLYTYTGQASYMDDPTTVGVTEGFGWMFYNARWYDPALGRFAQADTMIPDGIQGLDHYAYVNNNPVNGTDPTGHHCDEDINGKCILPTGSPTDKLFVDSSSSIPPSTAVTPYNGDTCNNCGVEPEINLSNPQSAGYKATAAGVVIQVASDVGNSIQDFHAQNDKDIPVYVNVATNTDGSVTVPSIEVDNKTSIEVSVIAVKFRVEGGNGCKYVFTACLSAGPYSYNVSPGPGIYEPQSTPGLGIIQPHTNQQISISPSGYGNNPTNTFRTGFTVRITLGYTAGGRTFLPISFSFP